MTKNIALLIASLFMVGGLGSTASAADDSGYQGRWGMAGCGLWAGIIKGKDKNSQIGVWALRNAVLNSQTSAITSGTSNCVEDGSSYSMKEKEVFMEVNFNSLSKEAAQGQGEHLQAFGEILGCEDKEAFATFSQSNYGKIFKSEKPQRVLDNYLDEVKKDQSLAKACLRVS